MVKPFFFLLTGKEKDKLPIADLSLCNVEILDDTMYNMLNCKRHKNSQLSPKLVTYGLIYFNLSLVEQLSF